MLKVVAFMKQVAEELRMGGNFGTAHVYRSSTNAIIAYCGKGDFSYSLHLNNLLVSLLIINLFYYISINIIKNRSLLY